MDLESYTHFITFKISFKELEYKLYIAKDESFFGKRYLSEDFFFKSDQSISISKY